MRVLRIITTILFLASLFNCATVPELPVPDITVYVDPPPQYETVWIIKASSGQYGTVEKSENAAINMLKREADAIEANGVIITHMEAWKHTSTTKTTTKTAYGSYTTTTTTTTYSTKAVGLAIYVGFRQMSDTVSYDE
jgi:hypothetical protein